MPVCASFESILGLPVVLLGFAAGRRHAHAPNEWMWMANYETGIRTMARYWDEASSSRALLSSIRAGAGAYGIRRVRALTSNGASGRVQSGWVSACGCADTMPRRSLRVALAGGTSDARPIDRQAPQPVRLSVTWRLDTDNGSMVPRSALDVLVDLNDNAGHRRSRPSTSRCRSASPRSTRPSAAGSGPASCSSSAAPRARARRRWPSRWPATSPRAARPTCSTSASSTRSSTCSTG